MIFLCFEDVTFEALSQHTLTRGPGKSCVVQGEERQSVSFRYSPALGHLALLRAAPTLLRNQSVNVVFYTTLGYWD